MYSSWPTAISKKIFLPQGILLDLGGLFILLVTSVREWNAKFANAKPIGLRKILPYDSLHYPHWNVSLIVTTISISFAWSSDLVPSSPSFFKACKSDPPLRVLCSIFWFHKDGIRSLDGPVRSTCIKSSTLYRYIHYSPKRVEIIPVEQLFTNGFNL